jgi:hypothetical protein
MAGLSIVYHGIVPPFLVEYTSHFIYCQWSQICCDTAVEQKISFTGSADVCSNPLIVKSIFYCAAIYCTADEIAIGISSSEYPLRRYWRALSRFRKRLVWHRFDCYPPSVTRRCEDNSLRSPRCSRCKFLYRRSSHNSGVLWQHIASCRLHVSKDCLPQYVP